MKDFKFKNQISDEFDDSTLSTKDNIELSVLHMNIRSLNAKCTQLCQFYTGDGLCPSPNPTPFE